MRLTGFGYCLFAVGKVDPVEIDYFFLMDIEEDECSMVAVFLLK